MKNFPSEIEISFIEQLSLSMEKGVLTLSCLAKNSESQRKIKIHLSREALFQLSEHFLEMKQLLSKLPAADSPAKN